MNGNVFDLAIIGAGAVGLSTAWKIQRHYPDMRIAVLDKEAEVSAHQTGHNSGVIHSGLYYKPGSLKARLCVQGRDELVAFCREYEVAHDVCGKIVVAATEDELPRLDKIFATGLANGLSAIERIDARQILEHEPYCRGIAGIWVPYTGIVDFPGVCRALAQLIPRVNRHSKVITGAEVVQLYRKGNVSYIETPRGQVQARYVIACAGLESDRIARMDGLRPQVRIVGFRGDYYDLSEQGMHKVRNLIYPVPNPAFPFLGVHFTRMVLGGVECGPNAVFVFKREGYGKTDFDFRDTRDALGYAGTWNLFCKHWRFGLDEYRRAFSKARFLKQLQRLLPGLVMEDLVPGRSGVRAMALAPDGSMVDDFAWETHQNAIHVLNAPSPAATACLAIGDEILAKAQEEFAWN
ncbi:MAG: L-2-hydroxyglutarate oxidase [Bacteroidetes bacterium]|nr:L-2-hydroxyglutarate oxidase [Bacteroidota bacterium]